MFILRAIGRFFARIGRWIKDTAWIQPLLIVGGIFAIIFSIPYITSWVKTWGSSGTASDKYYESHKVKLTNAEDAKSDVDGLFDYISSYSNDKAKFDSSKAKYGEKFFLCFVQEGCSGCEERYPGYNTLEQNWGKGEFEDLKDDNSFKLYSIYVDTKNDDGDNLFEKVYNRDIVGEIFEDTISTMADNEHPYAVNGQDAGSYSSQLENLTNPSEISTPTTFLFDFTNKAPAWTSSFGVREVLFNFESTGGSDNFAKARTLRNAWTNVASSDNIFSASYRK